MSIYSLIGYNIAHGYSLSDDDFSSHAGVLGPQTSNQFDSGASLNTNHASVSPRDKMQAMSHQSFVLHQREPVHYENNEDASYDSSLREEMVQSKPDSGHEPDEFLVVPSTPPVQKYEHESSGYQHPFGLLLKEHTQNKTMEGISFPTIKNLKQFIETMKSSFLMPRGDLSRHFQTAREIMENNVAYNAQNTEGEHDVGYRSNSAKEGTVHDEASENEVWSEPMTTVFGQSEHGANYQMPSESLSVPEPVESTARLTSTSVYDSQDLGPRFALYPRHHLAEHVSSSHGSFDNGEISGENPDSYTSGHDVRNEDIQSPSYKLPEQIPSGSFFPPLTSEKNIQHPKYTSNSKDSLTGYPKPPGGFELGEEFQSNELGRATPANVRSAPEPPSLNSYGKSVYVRAPRRKLYIQDVIPKHRERPASSFHAYRPTVGKESKETNHTPTVHLPVSSDSVSSSYENLSPQSSSGLVGVQTSSPHDAQSQTFNRNQPVRPHPLFTVKPPSSVHGSSRDDGYLGDQRVRVTRPSILTARAKDEEKSHVSRQNLASARQEPKQMTDHNLIPITGGLDSAQSGISSQVGVGYESFNSLTNLPPASERVFPRLVRNEVILNNFRIRNSISKRFPTGDIRGAKKPHSSFSAPQRRGIYLNGDYVSATRPSFSQTFIKPPKLRKRPATVKQHGNMAYWPPKPLSASKVSGSALTGVFWRNGGNTKRLPPQMGPMSPYTYVVKSRSSYVRGKVSLSKTHYAPYQPDEGENW